MYTRPHVYTITKGSLIRGRWIQKERPEGRSFGRRKGLLALLCFALLFFRSVLLFHSFIELGGYEHHAVVLNALGILPFLRFEVVMPIIT